MDEPYAHRDSRAGTEIHHQSNIRCHMRRFQINVTSYLQQDHDVARPVGSEFFFGFLDGGFGGFPKKVLGLVRFLLLHDGDGGDQSGGCGHQSLVSVIGGRCCLLLEGRREANGGRSARSCCPAGCHSKGGRRDHLVVSILCKVLLLIDRCRRCGQKGMYVVPEIVSRLSNENTVE